jgi:hypothetical protein
MFFGVRSLQTRILHSNEVYSCMPHMHAHIHAYHPTYLPVCIPSRKLNCFFHHTYNHGIVKDTFLCMHICADMFVKNTSHAHTRNIIIHLRISRSAASFQAAHMRVIVLDGSIFDVDTVRVCIHACMHVYLNIRRWSCNIAERKHINEHVVCICTHE